MKLTYTLILLGLTLLVLPSSVTAEEPIRIGVVDVDKAVKSTKRMKWIQRQVEAFRGADTAARKKAEVFHRREMEQIRKMVGEVCTKLARSRGLELILTTGRRSPVVFSARRLDLTKELAAALDAALPIEPTRPSPDTDPVPSPSPAPSPDRVGLPPIDVEFDDEDTHLVVGASTTFHGTLRNDGKTVMRNVHLALRLPAGLVLDTSKLPSGVTAEHLAKGIRIPDMKPGQRVDFRAVAKCAKAGRHLAELSVVADGFPKPVLDHESAHVR